MACQKACPVVAIDRGSSPRTVRGKQVKHLPLVDREVCLGCGVCALTCKQGALKMAARARRRITPESTFARILSMALEQGRLHELLIDADAGLPAAAASALLGAILRLPPARQLLVSEALESRFVNLVIAAAKRSGAKEVDI
ncbi:MAG: hypothetical protein FJ125_13490 [Deltaproteobacteria bacterium]|nr:hypothetical protein [Deltaproteobacteria bacterium]